VKSVAPFLLLLLVFDARVVFERKTNSDAKPDFKFKNIAAPSNDDAAAQAKLTLIDGDLDQNSTALSALIDGRGPRDEDEPSANVFFNSGSSGGRFRMDLGSVVDVAQVNSYSWHPGSRGPQLYKLYGADGSESKLNLDPKRGVDPASSGWKFIALVNTLAERGEDGGQYAVSVSDANGSLGKYRYLLFDCYVTELYNNNGNTFYSEIDIIRK